MDVPHGMREMVERNSTLRLMKAPKELHPFHFLMVWHPSFGRCRARSHPRSHRFGNRRGPVLILVINFFGSSAFPGAGFCFIGVKGCELQVSIRTPLRSSICTN
jgi:hypothetical protein